ncbi:MAG: response regulator transcription factor [Firmicutes bacterium]|nr:response regulator transcription factor [Bacillota bacterium]
MQKILLVEDDIAITKSLGEFLRSEGFDVVCAASERSAQQALMAEKPQLLLVDVSLENRGSGFNVCRSAKMLKLPVIFLTAKTDEDSVVKGLDMGADDYVPKPFRPRELLSRIRNVLRHYEGGTSVVTLGLGIAVDTDRGAVMKNGREISLSALEYKLLTVFVDNRGILLTRNKLLELIWDIAGDYVNDNTLTVYIKRLREKIEDDPQDPQLIKTVRGLGYRMD